MSVGSHTEGLDHDNSPTQISEFSTTEFRLGRRPSLDGLRALAVLAVLARHAEVPLGDGGFLGVDIFFVLSGLLITALLLEEHRRSDRINLRRFMARRVRRLLPAFIAFVVGTLAIVYPNVTTGQRRSLLGGLASSVLYVRNWDQIISGRGLAGFTQPHLWSLAVEEQFYLVWPILFLGIVSWRGRTRLMPPLLALFSLSAMLAVVLLVVTNDNQRLYLGTDVRAAQVLAGALGAVLIYRAGSLTLPKTIARVPTDLALAALISAVVLIVGVIGEPRFAAVYYPVGIALFGVLVAAFLVALIQTPESRVNRVLSTRPLVFIGSISYSFYLWHTLIITLVTPSSVVRMSWFHVQMPVLRVGAALVGSICVASLSTFTIERWCQSHLFRWADRH